jgi:ATP-dependent DNA helicase RecG
VLFKTTFLENWGSGVSRIMDACREANLPEPEYNQNASFVWVTFKRNTIPLGPKGRLPEQEPYNHTTPTTPQVKNPSTPTTSKREDAKLKRLKTLLTAIGENGANLKVLMESLQRRDRKGFVSTYITPNIEAGYIAMLYPETPNHPMQSYYLTNKGREALNNL